MRMATSVIAYALLSRWLAVSRTDRLRSTRSAMTARRRQNCPVIIRKIQCIMAVLLLWAVAVRCPHGVVGWEAPPDSPYAPAPAPPAARRDTPHHLDRQWCAVP